MNRWWTFVKDGLDKLGWTAAQLAETAGYHESTVSNWKKGGATPRPEQIRATTQALGLEYIDGLIAAGVITLDDLGKEPTALPDLSRFGDEEVINEAAARMQEATARMRAYMEGRPK